MEIRTLQYFLTVAREQNMTGAANLLHITQPTLSRQMVDLEQELGKKLFIRTNRSTLLTEEGIRLRQRAEEIVSLVQQTKTEISDNQPELTGCIRIGAGETPIIHFLTDAFAKLKRKHPGITCELFTGNADTVEDKLSHGLVDFALFIEPFNPEKYESLRLPESNRVGIITCRDTPWARLPAITADTLSHIPLLISSRTATAVFDISQWSQGKDYQCPRHRRALPTPDTGPDLRSPGTSRHLLMSRVLEEIPAPVADVQSLFERPEGRDSSTRKGLIKKKAALFRQPPSFSISVSGSGPTAGRRFPMHWTGSVCLPASCRCQPSAVTLCRCFPGPSWPTWQRE